MGPIDRVTFTQPVQDALYRITQEALNNVLKHAHAYNVSVTLRQLAETAVLEVSDDGVGE